MKLLFTVMDGASGSNNPDLDNKTSLEAANTPALSQLAKNSKMGLMSVVPGIAPESDSAVLSLLGYDPNKYYTGRGPLEAIGAGMDFKDGDLALRCNFATVDNKKIIDRRVGRSLKTKEAKALQKIINKRVKLSGAKFEFRATLGHRGALIIRSSNELYPNITYTDPAYDKKGFVSMAKKDFEPLVKESVALDKKSELSAHLVNEFSEKTTAVLDECRINRTRQKKGLFKANAVLMRDAGNENPKLFNINERYGVKWAILANMPLERGIAGAAGMDVIKINDEKNYDEWVNKTIKAMKKYDCLYIHLKGPDEPGHDGDALRKKLTIEEIDNKFYSRLIENIDLNDTIVVVTSDHCTPCSMKAHSSDPVALMISHPRLKDSYPGFDEKICKKGNIFLNKGTDLMPLLMEIFKESV
ncbi:2,3-bisphosphoglycerate-independent phosphoglycerate mutase [Candidatus Woesearchaeota archaeon]|nr:2,3-bisphosphoglycerate-independent phosphoglycerate mutase [Candidatus Woesearchaeota archaeon]